MFPTPTLRLAALGLLASAMLLAATSSEHEAKATMLPASLRRTSRPALAYLAAFMVPLQGLDHSPCPCAAGGAGVQATKAPLKGCCCSRSCCTCCAARARDVPASPAKTSRSCCDNQRLPSEGQVGYSSHCCCHRAANEALPLSRVGCGVKNYRTPCDGATSACGILARHPSAMPALLLVPGPWARPPSGDLFLVLQRLTI